MVQTGTVGGDNGPTVFVMQGKRCRVGYDTVYLLRHGAAPGSQVRMTDNAFMTEEFWEEMTPQLIEGYCSLPYVKDNPDWWILEAFDGFGPHYSSIQAMSYRWDHKCISLKEEGDSSSINQVICLLMHSCYTF